MADAPDELEGTHVLARGEDVPSVVAEHSAGVTMLNALMTFDPETGDTRPLVVYSEQITEAGENAQVSILIHMARDLILMAADRSTDLLRMELTDIARATEQAGALQMRQATSKGSGK